MADLMMGERWNTEDSLEMSLGVRKAIDSVMREMEPPSECSRLLGKGIEFLEEAKGGGALISGVLEEADSFNGTFLPLCLATDVYITFRKETPEKGGSYNKVGSLLNSYKDVLEEIKKGGLKSNISKAMLGEISGFFETLSKLLLQQSDPMTEEYSQSYI